MHVVLGSGERVSYRPEEFGAYYRRVRRRFVDFASFDRATEPYPVSHCSLCDFLPRCEADWQRTDHLSRVARLYRRHYKLLREGGIDTLASLARSNATVAGLEDAVFARLQEQAALQLRARETGGADFRLIEPVAETGLALLPPPSPRRPLLRPRGRPVLRRGRQPRVPLGRPRRGWLHRPACARPRLGAASVRGLRRPRPRAPARRPGAARLPLRAVRGHRRSAASWAARLARRGGRRPAAARRARRPLRRRPQRRPRLGAELLAQEPRGLPAARAACGDQGGRHVDRPLRGMGAHARRRDPARDRAVQRGGLRRHAAPARLAARAAARSARDVRPLPAARAGAVARAARERGRARARP